MKPLPEKLPEQWVIRDCKQVVSLNLSGGVQSSFLYWAIRSGLIRLEMENGNRPWFVSFWADPGNENPETYQYMEWLQSHANDDCPIFLAEGPKIVEELLDLKGKTRCDQPPLYVDKGNGKRGQLPQRCTLRYKVIPLRRAYRKWFRKKFCASPESSIAHQLIGYAFDESHRVDKFRHDGNPNYLQARFPLHELGIEKQDISQCYREFGVPRPPRSMCEICFAYGLIERKRQAKERPDSFRLVCRVDNELRDLSHCGVKYPAYLSDTLIPLEQLERQGFSTGDRRTDADHECNSGHCFI